MKTMRIVALGLICALSGLSQVWVQRAERRIEPDARMRAAVECIQCELGEPCFAASGLLNAVGNIKEET